MQTKNLDELIASVGTEVLNRVVQYCRGIDNVAYNHYQDGRIEFYKQNSSRLVYLHQPAYNMAYSSNKEVRR